SRDSVSRGCHEQNPWVVFDHIFDHMDKARDAVAETEAQVDDPGVAVTGGEPDRGFYVLDRYLVNARAQCHDANVVVPHRRNPEMVSRDGANQSGDMCPVTIDIERVAASTDRVAGGRIGYTVPVGIDTRKQPGRQGWRR